MVRRFPPAQRAQSDKVSAQFVGGQRVMLDALREGGVILGWDLRLSSRIWRSETPHKIFTLRLALSFAGRVSAEFVNSATLVASYCCVAACSGVVFDGESACSG
jgi:hypothetical protein